MNTVVYLYGFVPADAPSPPRGLVGIGDLPVRLLEVGTLRAAVSDVPADSYSPQHVESRMQDLAWAGDQGVAHERVVVWFADHSEILPARLFSLYSSDEALRVAVAGSIAGVAGALEALTGRREWNLKVAFDRDELARHGAQISAALGSVDEEIAAASPGKRYLLERRRADMLKQEVSRAARRLAQELLDALGVHAEEVRVLPQPEGENGSGTVVLNAALLVARAAEEALRRDAAALHARYTALGMIVSFSGPWAPYRFLEVYGDA